MATTLAAKHSTLSWFVDQTLLKHASSTASAG